MSLVIPETEDLTDAVPVPAKTRSRITSTSRRKTKIDKKARSWLYDQVNMKVVEDGSIVEKPTNGFGEIDFKGAARKSKAKFVRLSDTTDPSKIFELLTKYWNLEPPRLVVSVSGGAKAFTLDPKLKQVFQQGLVKVSETPGAWIITGGTNTGVMQMVGEALEGTKKTCIGISTYGIVTNREHLEAQFEQLGGKFPYRVSSSLVEKGAYLDHNHTHHLMVDDGSTEKYGGEIIFRSQFEKHIIGKNIPSVLLILQGGVGTIKTIWSAIAENVRTSIVVVKESGKAADLFAYAIDLTKRHNCLDLDSVEFYAKIYEIVSWLFDADNLSEEVKEKCCEQVIFCMRKKEQFSVFEMKGESGVDEAILMALLNCNNTTEFDQLQLTLLWNRVDLARETVLAGPCNWTKTHLDDAMIMSLALDRVDFVRLFLRYGVSIESILTNDVLEFLYGYAAQASPKSTFKYEFDEAEYSETNMGEHKCAINLLCNYVGINPRQCSVPRNIIQQVIRVLTNSLVVKGNETFVENATPKQNFDYPYRELFFWALLNNKQEMAMFLWEFEEEAISKALIGGEINRVLMVHAQKLELQDDHVKTFANNASEFKELAYKILDECYKEDINRTVQLITTEFNQFPFYTSLNLAVTTGDMEFVSHHAVQFLLNEVWTGSIKMKDVTSDWQLFFCYICPPLISQLRFYSDKACKYRLYDGFKETDNEGDETEDDCNGKSNFDGTASVLRSKSCPNGNQSEKLVKDKEKEKNNSFRRAATLSFFKKEKPKCPFSETTKYGSYESISRLTWKKKEQDIPYYKKFIEFYLKTPLIKCISNTASYFIFLFLFAYVCMTKKEHTMMYSEYVLLLFVISFTVAEVYQIAQGDSQLLTKKIKEWFNSRWNRLDACAMLMFFVAFGFRMNPSTLEVGHVLLAVDGGFWVIRLLHVFYLHRILGPYVVMINRMTSDLLYFSVIMSVFLFAYGVVAKSLLEPQPFDAPISSVLTSVTFHPYFNIYGELFVDRDPADNETTRFGTPVINSYAEPLSWFFLGAYLLITNILLVNILIAIFNNTFNDVQEKSDQIWKFERHGLVIEYAQRVALVPPISLLVHFALLLRWIFRCVSCRTNIEEGYNCTLKSEVTEEIKEELVEFESNCVASFVRKKELLPDKSMEEASFDILGQVENIQTTMRHLNGRLNCIQNQLKHLK